MAEMNDSNTEKKGFFQKIADKFKNTSEKVADKVEDTIEDVKNSEFAGKVTETAQNISAKAKDSDLETDFSRLEAMWSEYDVYEQKDL